MVYGIHLMVQNHQFVGTGFLFLILATVLGWLALNVFGFFQNSRMRGDLSLLLDADAILPQERLFVGFSSPRYTGLLDAHEDVGFLCFGANELRFVSETRTVEILKSQIQGVAFRPSVHTLVGLGRWISIDGLKQGTPIRMLVEPRERKTMLGNLLLSHVVRDRIEAWSRSGVPFSTM